MYVAGPYRFTPNDAQKTFANLGVLWGQLIEGRDAMATTPVASTLVSALAAALGPPPDVMSEADLLTPMGERAAATLKAGRLDPDIVERNVARLAAEIDDGTWDQKYGHLRERDSIDLGYRLIVCG